MSTDDDFARDLRARLDDALPPLPVRTDRVRPRARRRRAVTRSAQVTGAVGAMALVAVTAAGAWGGAAPWTGSAVPAGSGTAAASATGSADPAPSATIAADAGTYPATGTIADAEGHTYWYTLAQGQDGSTTEVWSSLDQPGLVVTDGDLSTAYSVSPTTGFGSYVIDGVRYESLTDVSALPTDPEALRDVLDASVEPDQRSGTDEDKVFGMVADLLTFSPGLLPAELRAAAWQVATDLPGASVTTGTDDDGRTVEVLDYGTGDAWRELMLDPTTSLVLQQSGRESRTVYLTQGPADSLPVQPTATSTGCASVAGC
ncbi:MAG TPA: hypothetical protein VGC67_09840 [Cellulomonas sp.]